jgi:hypothetical protein
MTYVLVDRAISLVFFGRLFPICSRFVPSFLRGVNASHAAATEPRCAISRACRKLKDHQRGTSTGRELLVFPHFERRNSARLALALDHRTVFKFANLACPTRMLSWSRRSCAQASHGYFWKPFLYNTFLENKRLVQRFGSGWRCRNVPPHAQSPPNFPHSEITTKVFRIVPSSLRLDASFCATVWKTGGLVLKNAVINGREIEDAL